MENRENKQSNSNGETEKNIANDKEQADSKPPLLFYKQTTSMSVEKRETEDIQIQQVSNVSFEGTEQQYTV